MSLDLYVNIFNTYMLLVHDWSILFKGAYVYIFVHILTQYIFMEYKKNERKFIQRKNLFISTLAL